MATPAQQLAEEKPGNRPLEIQASLRRLERRDWWLWWAAMVVMMTLTAGVVAIAVAARTLFAMEGDLFFGLHISQASRGLVGVVLLFNIYTIYQRFLTRRLRRQLGEQMEITIREQMRAEQFYELALLDVLTGLHNRRFAEERLVAEMSRAKRRRQPLTLLMLDLDDFKEINDNHGHAAGDLVLKEFAARLSKLIRGSDLAVRMGGDEFLVLLPECHFGHVQTVLARLRPLEVEFSGKKIPVAFSAGWTDYRTADTPQELVQRADHALYADKRGKANIDPSFAKLS